MRPLVVVVLDELTGEMVEMPLPEHDEVVQALVPRCLDEAFTDGVPVEFQWPP